MNIKKYKLTRPDVFRSRPVNVTKILRFDHSVIKKLMNKLDFDVPGEVKNKNPLDGIGKFDPTKNI